MSASNRSDSKGAGKPRRSKKASSSAAGGSRGGGSRKQDLGRALRTVYDDTLREPVPDDFLNLIGKLT